MVLDVDHDGFSVERFKQGSARPALQQRHAALPEVISFHAKRGFKTEELLSLAPPFLSQNVHHFY
jgi:hypothetical protein